MEKDGGKKKKFNVVFRGMQTINYFFKPLVEIDVENDEININKFREFASKPRSISDISNIPQNACDDCMKTGKGVQADLVDTESDSDVKECDSEGNITPSKRVKLTQNDDEPCSSKDATITLSPIKTVDRDSADYRLLRDKISLNFSIPGLMTDEQLRNECSKLFPETNVDLSPSMPKRKLPRNVLPREYEVEDIIDCETDARGKTMYLVKWVNYGHDQNTWEPEENLEGCTDYIDDFESRPEECKSLIGDNFINYHSLRSTLAKLIAPTYDDVGVLLKLNAKYLSEFNHTLKLTKELKEFVKNRYNLLEDSLPSKSKLNNNMTMKKTFNQVVRDLYIIESFQTLDKFFDFVIERPALLRDLKSWKRDINRTIKENREGEVIEIENLVDLERPPEDFNYITENKLGDGVTISCEDPPLYCECVDCFEEKNCCFTNGGGTRMAYTRKGALLLRHMEEKRPIYECNKNCKCPRDCPNRVVQKGRKHKLSIFRTDNGCGWGVRALERIPQGTFVMEYLGEIIKLEEANERGKICDQEGLSYLFDLDYTEEDHGYLYVIDAAKYGNISHFVNHSCDPNLQPMCVWIDNLDIFMPHIALFTKRDIRANEELTFDYKMDLGRLGELSEEKTEEERTEEEIPTTSRDDSGIGSESDQIVKTSSLARVQCKCGANNCRIYLY